VSEVTPDTEERRRPLGTDGSLQTASTRGSAWCIRHWATSSNAPVFASNVGTPNEGATAV
jgi:hypothetical protein